MCVELIVVKGSFSQCFIICNVLVLGVFIEMNLENGLFIELYGVWQFKVLGEKVCKIIFDLIFDYVGLLVKVIFGLLFIQVVNIMVDVFCQCVK